MDTARLAHNQSGRRVREAYVLAVGTLRPATAHSTMLRMTKQHEEPTRRVMLNLPASVSEALRQAAQAKRWSMSLAGRVAVEQWLAEREHSEAA
jgi:hypothetical protein